MTAPAPFEHFDDLSPAELEHRAMLYTRKHHIWAGSHVRIFNMSPEGMAAERKLKGGK